MVTIRVLFVLIINQDYDLNFSLPFTKQNAIGIIWPFVFAK